ncbi:MULTISPECIES: LysM peptidoglycan-binding domain-containing protein [Lysinibacillus]|uniref:LysM peptidoglycan-binding domain-containing protein n=1 Tax=Lysinibacillus tabacifolii TaxID=1173107 RepID=A0ABY2T1G8_9BACI|nr:LysM peptidoglycan-binding domain-containing protein [Lysinibacillus tabacifolii]TKI49862.1 LysM peptidoglycan-binding domain-containing protein [Lysinibacillus tabacifolii]
MIGIYLSANNDKEGFRIPVNPPELSFKQDADGEEFSVAKIGTVKVPKPMKLPEFSFSSFFPAQDTHYAETQFIEPKKYIDQIKKWMAEETVIRFVYVGGSFSINGQFTIESFEAKDQFGTSDVDYTISFKKYVPFGFKKMELVHKSNVPTVSAKKKTVKKVVKKEAPRENSKQIPQTYSLVKGDSLWKIAQKYTGNGANYKALQTLNGIKDSDLRKLPIGLKVKIPPEWTAKK